MRVDVERRATAAVKKLARYKFHRDHGIQARQILRTIEKRRGKTNPRVLRQIESYAQDVFGDAVYAPWLRVYTALNGTFKEGWIPDNYYGAVVVPRIKGCYGKISALRCASRLIFRDRCFPDIGYFANGLFYTAENTFISDDELQRTILGAADRIAFKLDNSGQGRGVFILDRQSFNAEFIRSMGGNGVFQPFVRQHEVFNRFTPDSVATLRFTTVVEPAGAISLRACFLRLGRAGETHIQTGSEICVPVNTSTGELDPVGYLNDWTDVREHPDTRENFFGVTVPAFRDCIKKVLELHSKVPFIGCIGWDVTVDVGGDVKVLEWNAEHNDVQFGEATQGPCFSDLGWELL
ncbi:sugar-transfer associated ATP-grasp domain-containing protein [Paraburkholderia sp. RL18-103-BIB-C]|uniref:sugar-transfer associated ATP-grasp domain-containing protein n=1 Tax=unclassified Paraburkholderia TaxID=2615204 RepID=UPI0038B9823B